MYKKLFILHIICNEYNTYLSELQYKNIENMKKQLQRLGYMYDWNREVSTCSKAYYFEEQKLFLEFHRKGLVYRKQSLC